MVCVTAISDDILAMLGRHTSLVEFSAPLDMPMPSYDRNLIDFYVQVSRHSGLIGGSYQLLVYPFVKQSKRLRQAIPVVQALKKSSVDGLLACF